MADKKKLFLEDPVSSICGVGPKKSAALIGAGFASIFDLLRIYPAKYQDRRSATTIDALTIGSPALIKAELLSIKSYYARRGLTVISAEFSDHSGKVSVRWFNRVYLCRQLKPGKKYWLFGSAAPGKTITISNPEIEAADEDEVTASSPNPQLTPVYPSNTRLSEAKISPLSLRKLIDSCLDYIDWPGSFPDFIRNSPFMVIAEALQQIHRPDSEETVNKARHTLAFFDQVLFQIGVLKRREALTGFLTMPDTNQAKPWTTNLPLPFVPTRAQSQALGEIMADLDPQADKPPMSRLLQGDVGSGKTLVAFLAMLHFTRDVSRGSQCVFMAPTEILARQHLHSFKLFFPQFADLAAILTGSQKTAERKAIVADIANGSTRFIFGTHALFQEKVQFSHLEFCVIDEQQRFGVNHRRLLFNKGKNPHQLLLSATPIPRTLSLTIFGDMDTSIINELPPGRQPIKTIVASSFSQAVPLIKETINKGRQVYLVCPLIEISDKKDWTSVEEAAERIAELLPQASYACLTGQQSWNEKEAIMHAFKRGELQIIIATTVVEVGVDNPEASLMIIENADCFGLSQLHQLRGRVGRGAHLSTCVLVSHLAESCERLNILASTNDGFELSLEDLKLRGPGDLVGTRQSGLSHPCFSHRIPQKLVENARIRAFEILTGEKQQARHWFLQQMEKSFGQSYKTFMEGG